MIHFCVAAWGLAQGIWQPQIGGKEYVLKPPANRTVITQYITIALDLVTSSDNSSRTKIATVNSFSILGLNHQQTESLGIELVWNSLRLDRLLS